MKTLKIIYWTSTIIFACIFMTTGTSYLLHRAAFVKRALDLHYPEYLLDIIGTAKILGGIALVTPKFKYLKEWAYAGFVIDFVGAIWSHLYVQGVSEAVRILLPLSILAISYITYRRLQANPSTAIIKPGQSITAIL
jgi:uncharacterized membrane protein YphA (DoxX/SURF4 family)